MTTPRHLLATIGILSLLFGGCGKRPASPPATTAHGRLSKPLTAPPEVTAETEEAFHDLVFYIQEHTRLPDGSQTLRASGTHRGRQLGLAIVLGPTWQAASLGKDLPLVTYRGTVAYRSTGSDSDAVVQVLDELYGTKVKPTAMRKETQFAGISLEGNPRELAKGPVKIKLFFDSGGQEDYAELFTNIELTAHRLEVSEKDESYRLPVVKALQAR
jgi:hypothetical protein